MIPLKVITPANFSPSFFDLGENTANLIEPKFGYSVAKLKASVYTPTVVFVTDLGKEGVFCFDATDITSVDDGINILVKADTKRYKRKSDVAFSTIAPTATVGQIATVTAGGKVTYLDPFLKNGGTIGGALIASSFKLPNAAYPNLVDNGNDDNYLNVRVIQNKSALNQDGLYIGYANNNNAGNRIYDGTSSNYLLLAGATLSTGNLTKFLFGNQTDDGTFAQFSGDVKAKGILRTNSHLAMDINDRWFYMTDNTPTNRRIMGLASDNTFYIGDVDNNIVSGNNLYMTKGVHSFRNNGVEKVRIAQNGNVGIGTTNPFTTFHVKVGTNQNILFTQNLNGGDAGTSGIVSVNDANSAYAPLGFWSSKFAFMGGSLLIGSTVTSGEALQVTGSTKLGTTLIGGAGLTINTAGNVYASFTYIDTQLGGNAWLSGPGVGTGNPTGFSILYNSTTVGNIIYAKNNGYVGIGTTVPLAKLDVNGDLFVNNGSDGSSYTKNQIQFGWNNSSLYAHSIRTRHSADVAANNAIDFYTWKFGDASNVSGGKLVMSINGSGNVGIGTTAPTKTLDVNGSIGFNGSFTSPFRTITGPTATYTILANDHVVMIDTSPACVFNVDVPSATNIGREIVLVNKSIGTQYLGQNYINSSRQSTNQLPYNTTTRLKYDGTNLQQI